MNREERFQNDIDHIWVAYFFFEQFVPNEEDQYPQRFGDIEFQKRSEVQSVRVELGWAFFVRLEACLESLLHELHLSPWELTHECESLGIPLTAAEKDGLRVYREIRNVLHHADGDPARYTRNLDTLDVPAGHEPQLEREHVERFYRLFRRIGAELARMKSGPELVGEEPR